MLTWILVALGIWELICIVMFIIAVSKIGPPIDGLAWLVGLTLWPLVLKEIWDYKLKRR
jgi:hypothetical protein